MGDVGFRISIKGKDALSSIDPRSFVVNSKYKPLKITQYGKGQITVGNNATATLDIVHGLGYAPMQLSYYEIDNNGKYWLDGTQQGTLSVESTGNTGGYTTVDRYKIRFSISNVQGNGTGFTAPFRYVLLDQGAFDDATGNDKPVGYQNSNVGMIVTPSGKDATKSKIYEQIINSNTDMLKFNSTTVLTLVWDNHANGQASKDFVHGLGYVPLFVAFGYFDNSVQEIPIPTGGAPSPFISSAFADTNKIRVEIAWAGSPVPSTGNFYARIVVFKNNMLQ